MIYLKIGDVIVDGYHSLSVTRSFSSQICGFNFKLSGDWAKSGATFSENDIVHVVTKVKTTEGDNIEQNIATGYIYNITFEYNDNESSILFECKDKTVDLKDCNMVLPTTDDVAYNAPNKNWRSEYNTTVYDIIDNWVSPFGIKIEYMPEEMKSKVIEYNINPQNSILKNIKDISSKFNLFFFTNQDSNLVFIKGKEDLFFLDVPSLEFGVNVESASMVKNKGALYSRYESVGQQSLKPTQTDLSAIKASNDTDLSKKFDDMIDDAKKASDKYLSSSLIETIGKIPFVPNIKKVADVIISQHEKDKEEIIKRIEEQSLESVKQSAQVDSVVNDTVGRFRPKLVKIDDDVNRDEVKNYLNKFISTSVGEHSKLTIQTSKFTYDTVFGEDVFKPSDIVRVDIPFYGTSKTYMMVDSVNITVSDDINVILSLVKLDMFGVNSLNENRLEDTQLVYRNYA